MREDGKGEGGEEREGVGRGGQMGWVEISTQVF